MTKAEKLLMSLLVFCVIFLAGAATGYYLHTPKIGQKDINKEQEIGGKFAEERAADKDKGDTQKQGAAVAGTRIEYRNCKLNDEDFANLKEAFKP